MHQCIGGGGYPRRHGIACLNNKVGVDGQLFWGRAQGWCGDGFDEAWGNIATQMRSSIIKYSPTTITITTITFTITHINRSHKSSSAMSVPFPKFLKIDSQISLFSEHNSSLVKLWPEYLS